MTNTNKKTQTKNVNTKKVNPIEEENNAIALIKNSIKSTKDSYLDFLAGGIFLIIQSDDCDKNPLWSVIKTNDLEWRDFERQYQRRVASCYTLATRRFSLFKGKTSEEIRKILVEKKFTASKILEIEKMYKDQKNKKTESDKSKANESEEVESEEVEKNGITGISLEKLVERLKDLSKSESEKVAKAMAECGKLFVCRNMTEEEKKQLPNFYGTKKAVNE